MDEKPLPEAIEWEANRGQSPDLGIDERRVRWHRRSIPRRPRVEYEGAVDYRSSH